MNNYIIVSTVMLGMLGLIWKTDTVLNVSIKTALIFVASWGALICFKQF